MTNTTRTMTTQEVLTALAQVCSEPSRSMIVFLDVAARLARAGNDGHNADGDASRWTHAMLDVLESINSGTIDKTEAKDRLFDTFFSVPVSVLDGVESWIEEQTMATGTA